MTSSLLKFLVSFSFSSAIADTSGPVEQQPSLTSNLNSREFYTDSSASNIIKTTLIIIFLIYLSSVPQFSARFPSGSPVQSRPQFILIQ